MHEEIELAIRRLPTWMAEESRFWDATPSYRLMSEVLSPLSLAFTDPSQIPKSGSSPKESSLFVDFSVPGCSTDMRVLRVDLEPLGAYLCRHSGLS